MLVFSPTSPNACWAKHKGTLRDIGYPGFKNDYPSKILFAIGLDFANATFKTYLQNECICNSHNHTRGLYLMVQ